MKKTEKGIADRVLTKGRALIIDLFPMAQLQAPPLHFAGYRLDQLSGQ
jgi:hypothetical protein